MGHHFTTFEGSVTDAVRKAIEGAIAGAQVEVTGSGGHFSISVTSPAFAGKSMVESHRMVLSAIAHLMAGDTAPVHAVDSLKTRP
jgi:acid stress-induced BolA-like protein IbaG/YrbA